MGKIIGINGSPRRNWNCADLIDYALGGAKEEGAETVQYDLFHLKFAGCISCFACKLLDSPTFGRCVVRDDLTHVLEECLEADAIVLAAPVYFGNVPGAVHSLLERLWFPGLTYSKDGALAYTRRVPTALMFTMNTPDPEYYTPLYNQIAAMNERVIGPTSVLAVPDTLQFLHYKRYASEMFDGDEKRRRREKEFPKELEKARRIGHELARLSSGQ